MNVQQTVQAIALACCIALPCFAQVSPPMPGMTNGGDASNNGMKHVNISQAGTTLVIHIDSPPISPLIMRSSHGIDYAPDKFDVLEDVYLNAQYGWVSDGFFDLPTDGDIWIKRIAALQSAGASFKVFEAGNMMQGMDAWSMSEIFSVNGAISKWDGTMHHDYFTTDLPGTYSMSFEVYVGDSTGAPVPGFMPAFTTFDFIAVPEPAACSLALLGGCSVLAGGRRRRIRHR